MARGDAARASAAAAAAEAAPEPAEAEELITKWFGESTPVGTNWLGLGWRRQEAAQVILACETLSEAQLLEVTCGRPHGLEEAQFAMIARHPGFTAKVAGELGKAWSCLDRSYAQGDEFAETLTDVPLARVAIALSRHWWFASDWLAYDEDAKAQAYVDLVERTVRLGDVGLELIRQLCCDAREASRTGSSPVDNHHVFDAVDVAEAVLAGKVLC